MLATQRQGFVCVGFLYRGDVIGEHTDESGIIIDDTLHITLIQKANTCNKKPTHTNLIHHQDHHLPGCWGGRKVSGVIIEQSSIMMIVIF